MAALHKHRGMTQTALAAATGIPRTALWAMGNGTRRVGLAEALAIAAVLDVSLAEMVAAEPLVLRTETRIA